ncbi:hypothetical protein [Fusobacterium necrophorum]
MKLHYNRDGSIQMILDWKGKKIQKFFTTREEYLCFLEYLTKK